MPLFALPSIYLGSDSEARELHALAKSIAKKTDKFKSQNEFLKHCILYTLENDPDIKAAIKNKAH